MKNVFLGLESKAITSYLLDRLAKGRVGAEEVVAIMSRSSILREQFGDTLHSLSAGEGIQKGIAVALLAETAMQLKVLQSDDLFAQKALLACSRLARQKLPLETVGDLMRHADTMVARAAERYLESDDSRLARRIIHKHSKKLKILGARQSFDPGHETFAEFDRWENILLKEFTKDQGPDEIFALLSAGYWGSNGQRIIRIRNGEALYTLNGSGEQRNFENKLSPKEFQRLKQFLKEKDIDNLGPLNTAVHDGIQYEYVHLTKNSGRRVFMNNPGSGGPGGTAYDLLTRLFIEIGKTASLEKLGSGHAS